MPAQLSTRLTLDGSQHNEGLRNAAKELSKYKREVDSASKELKEFERSSRTAMGALKTFVTSMKSGNIDGMLISAKNAAGMLTKAGLGIIGVAAAGQQFVSFLQDSISRGQELAQEMEGVEIAFKRLNDPQLLGELRKATHNTVTDLELMKAAVKFDDFGLDVKQLGTFLAFAQQKAKETGQSVDYLVDSIVTGLGRKSLQIIDNLGISQDQVKEKMKETGDMTTAVAAIIQQRMAEAGDYVETAADRAKQKEVELENALTDLGKAFGPLGEAGAGAMHKIEVGAIKALTSVMKMLRGITEAGRIANKYENLGGDDKVGRMLGNLDKATNKQSVFTRQQSEIWRYINKIDGEIKDWEHKANDSTNAEYSQAVDTMIGRLQEQKQAALKMLQEYKKGAQAVLDGDTKTPSAPSTSDTTKTKKTGGSSSKKVSDEEKITQLLQKEWAHQQKLAADAAEDIKNAGTKASTEPSDAFKAYSAANVTTPDESDEVDLWEQVQDIKRQIDEILDKNEAGFSIYADDSMAQAAIDSLNAKLVELGANPVEINIKGEKNLEKMLSTTSKIADAASNVGSLFGSIGEATGDEGMQAAGIIAEAIANIVASYAAAANSPSVTGTGWGWIAFAIAGLAQVAATVSQIHSLSGYAGGGIIKGNRSVGDMNYARVNDGEMILNDRQQSHLFNMLDAGAEANRSMIGVSDIVVRGSDLYISLRNYSKEQAFMGKNIGIH